MLTRNEILDMFIVKLNNADNQGLDGSLCYLVDTFYDLYPNNTYCNMYESFHKLDIPILGAFRSYWFESNLERIKFLKAIKTC